MVALAGRSPHGERGLKYLFVPFLEAFNVSLPTRGAWIEITRRNGNISVKDVAPHTGSVD